MSTFCVVVTYGTMKRDSAVLTVVQKSSRPAVALLCYQANAVSELILVKPDGIINGHHVIGAAICNLIYFAYLLLSDRACYRGEARIIKDEMSLSRIIRYFIMRQFNRNIKFV